MVQALLSAQLSIALVDSGGPMAAESQEGECGVSGYKYRAVA